jgi:hypothetical protein
MMADGAIHLAGGLIKVGRREMRAAIQSLVDLVIKQDEPAPAIQV